MKTQVEAHGVSRYPIANGFADHSPVLDIKRQTYEKLGEQAPERTIFATNSSTLLPSDIADFTGR